MSEEKANIIYTAATIQQYHAGKLSPAEMHTLEKAALDDPFLAEALEGFEAMQNDDLHPALTHLHTKFSTNKTGRIVPLPSSKRFILWKIAAAVLIIVSGLAITYLFTNKETATDQSVSSSPTQKNDPPGEVATAIPPDTSLNTQKDLAATQPKATHKTNVDKDEQARKNSSATDITRVQKTTDNEENDSLAGKKDIAYSNNLPTVDGYNNRRNEQVDNNFSRNRSNENQVRAKNGPAAYYSFDAQIKAPDSTPLPFANIALGNKEETTYADVNGNVNIVSTDSLLPVNIRSEGYISKSYTLSRKPENNIIVLKEDRSAPKGKKLNTRNASSGISKHSGILKLDTLIDAAPVDGWKNYEIYIQNNLSIPGNEQGTMIISFDVHPNGVISNMNIEQSLCNYCDKEAQRVIKEGPAWTVKNGKSATARLRIIF